MSPDSSEPTDQDTTALPEQFRLRLDETTALLPPTSDDRIVRIAVQAVHCYPTNGEHSILTRSVMNALVANAQDIFARLSQSDRDLIKQVNGTIRFVITMTRLKALMGRENTTNYDQIYAAISAIRKWSIEWDVMKDFEEGTEVTAKADASFISQYERGVGRELGQVAYYFPYSVQTMLMEPSRYAQIDLRTANGLGSTYAKELYHQCARFLGTIKKVTRVLSVEEWTRLIAGKGKYVDRYKDFKRFALKPAMEWLAKVESCPFTVELLETHGPRNRVVGLQFKLLPKRQASLDMQMPPTWHPTLIDVLRTVYGMSNREIREIAMGATEAEMNEALQRDRNMVSRKLAQGDPVNNRAGYLRGILRNIQEGRPKDAEPVDEERELPGRDVADAVLKAKALREEFAKFRLTRLREHLDELPSDVVNELRGEFEDERGGDTAVSIWMRKGWDKAPAGLMATFLTWFNDKYPDRANRLLVKPEERDFDVWMVLRESLSPPSTASL